MKKLVAGLVTLGAAGAVLFYVVIRHGGPAVRPPSPVPSGELEALVGFIKHETCKPTTCNNVACETFSEGQTKGVPSYVVRCRWTDNTIPSTPLRCAYAHYSLDAARQVFTEMFLSAPALSDTCAPDKEFNAIIKNSAGYSGQLP